MFFFLWGHTVSRLEDAPASLLPFCLCLNSRSPCNLAKRVTETNKTNLIHICRLITQEGYSSLIEYHFVSAKMHPIAHLVVMPIPAWGHVRPLCAFIARILHLHPVYITFLIAGDNVSRVQVEFAQYFLQSSAQEKSKFVRVIGLGSLVPSVQEHVFSMGTIAQNYQQMYVDMLHCRPVTCAWTGTIHPAWNVKPTLVITDICSHFATNVTYSITGSSVPILVWVATPASSLIRLFGDESRGGVGDLAMKIEDYVQACGGNRRGEDCSGEVYRRCSNKLVHIPGLPPHYDHEWHPQEPRAPSRIPWCIQKGYSSLNLASGALSLSCESYEPESTQAVHDWFYEEGKEYFAVGVGTTGDWKIGGKGAGFIEDEEERVYLSKTMKSTGGDMLKSVSVNSLASSISHPTSSNDMKVRRLLDLALEQHGRHSLIYISFGSVFWPKECAHVWELIHTLLDLDIPFIFSHASSGGFAIPNDLSTRLADSQTGLLLEWVQQGVVLEHEATGWFITHCGANSVLEALYQGVPLICWPQEADQPANALYVSAVLDCGYELVQVRTGLGRRRMYRHTHPSLSYLSSSKTMDPYPSSSSLSSISSSPSTSPLTRPSTSYPPRLTIPPPITPSELLSPISPLSFDSPLYGPSHDERRYHTQQHVMTDNDLSPATAVASQEMIRAEFIDVLARARGPDGQRKKENAMKMGERLRAAWMDGGVSHETAKRFIRRFVNCDYKDDRR